MNLLQLGSKLRSAAVVAGAKDKIQQFLKSGSVLGRSPEDRFEQTYGFLCEPITGEKIYIGERLRNKLLGFVVEVGVPGIGRFCFYFRSFCLGRQLGGWPLGQLN